MQKNDIMDLTITDMGSDGAGIGKCGGMTFFVKNAVIGDLVRARIIKLKKSYGYAKIESVITPSRNRVVPECPLAGRCGGCQLSFLSYPAQLEWKQNRVRESLVRIGGFSPETVDGAMEPIVGMEPPYRYRNKAQFPIGTDREGNLVSGFYAPHSHHIIPVKDCLLGVPQNKEVLDAVLAYMREYGISAYDEATGEGLVRHVLVRYGFATNEIMACIIINGDSLPRQERLVGRLCAIEGMTSISINRNKKKTNVILGEETKHVWGKPYIVDEIQVMQRKGDNFPLSCLEKDEETAYIDGMLENEEGNLYKINCASKGIECEDSVRDCVNVKRENALDYIKTGMSVRYKISPQSFYQVNPRQMAKLYSLALEYAGLTGKETAWDLYCGIGTISLFLARNAAHVYGVEVVPQAVRDARENARLNGIMNAEFFEGKVEDVLPQFYYGEGGRGREAGDGEDTPRPQDNAGRGMHPDLIVVDPPRKGCDTRCLETMLKMQPPRIVYVSCDPATLARDLRTLCDGGYELRRVRAVDQFGQTAHVEVCALMER